MNLYASDAWLDSGGVEDADCIRWLLGDARGSVLEIGCGTGEAAAVFAKAGCGVTGVDLVDAALERAKQRCPGGRFLHADAAALPFANGAFAMAHMGCMRIPLQNTGKWDAACAEARRVLQADGLLLLGDLGTAEVLAGFALLRQRDATDALRAFGARWLWNNDEPFPLCGAKRYTLSVYQKK
ncbi:MAG: class I SAM-dependent methyltransferase [Eubacteriales bacterium]|nr:class I SAM-dependent methyltransferase [Eubacteriales bacterium]